MRDEKKVEVGWLKRRERVEESGREKVSLPKLTVRDQAVNMGNQVVLLHKEADRVGLGVG